MTLLNEGDSVSAWLESLARQTKQPDEIVICDAGSTDNTVEILKSAIRRGQELDLITRNGATISEGRNAAIKKANGEIIAVTDAGTILEPSWLENLVRPLRASTSTAVSAGFYRPAGRNFFERVLASVITPRAGDLQVDGFPPSSRSVAFRKCWWEKAGGYPEWLRTCEDLVFDFRLRELGAKFVFATDALVAWYPRPTLRTFFWQYFNYARGDGHARLFAARHLARYLSYTGGLMLIVSTYMFESLSSLVVLLLGITIYLRRFLARVRVRKPYGNLFQSALSFGLVPVIVLTGDIGKMIGYPLGRWERFRAGGPAGLREASIASPRASGSKTSHLID